MSDKLYQALLSSSTWFFIPRPFFKMMPMGEAVLLAYLINFAKMVGATQKNNGWFFCHMERIQKDLGFSKHAHTRMFSSLEDHGFIRTQKAGMPAKRYIKLNTKLIMERVRDIVESELVDDEDLQDIPDALD